MLTVNFSNTRPNSTCGTNPAVHVHQMSTFSAVCKEYIFTLNCVYIFLGHSVY
jgi:hypothetical protein